jgi:hypothetical protein
MKKKKQATSKQLVSVGEQTKAAVGDGNEIGGSDGRRLARLLELAKKAGEKGE